MYFIVLQSSTAAQKAKRLLGGYKISSSVGKISTKKGCRFGIYVSDNPDKACRLLSLNGMNCIEIRNGGDAG